MAGFHLKHSTRHLTSTAGLMLLGQWFLVVGLDRLDGRLPKRGKIRWSGLVKCYLGLLALGKSDFEALEGFGKDRFFREAPGLGQMPGSGWLRQSLEASAVVPRDHADAWSMRLIRRSGAPITADDGYACVDFETFIMDNSGTKKECVGRTYQGVDGYTPIAAGWRCWTSRWSATFAGSSG